MFDDESISRFIDDFPEWLPFLCLEFLSYARVYWAVDSASRGVDGVSDRLKRTREMYGKEIVDLVLRNKIEIMQERRNR